MYVWAGDVWTVGIEKGDESFCPPGSISQPMDHVAAEIHRLKQLKAVAEADLARTVAYLYDYANFAHPFREGNGRSTRVLRPPSLRTRRRTRLGEDRPDRVAPACHAARADSDLGGLIPMFA